MDITFYCANSQQETSQKYVQCRPTLYSHRYCAAYTMFKWRSRIAFILWGLK